MQAGQDTIYYLAGDDADSLRASPQFEGFRAKGFEVLLMSDPIDAFWPERLDSFEGKRLKSVTQATGDRQACGQPDISPLMAALKKALGDEVADVRATGRLTDSAVVLAASDRDPTCSCSGCCAVPAARCCLRHRCWKSIRATG